MSSERIRQNVISNFKKRQSSAISQINGTFYSVGKKVNNGDCGYIPIEIENNGDTIFIDINYGTSYGPDNNSSVNFSGVEIDNNHIDISELHRTINELYPNSEVYNIIVKVAEDNKIY